MESNQKQNVKVNHTADLLIGAGAFVVGNGILIAIPFLTGLILSSTPGGLEAEENLQIVSTLTSICGIVGLIANLVVLVAAAVKRPWVALGFLSPMVVLFALAILASLFLVAACFVVSAA